MLIFLLLSLLSSNSSAKTSEIVKIYNENQPRASGVIVYSQNNITGILTNHHACARYYDSEVKNNMKHFIYFDTLKVGIFDNNQVNVVNPTVVATDIKNDLCLMKIEGNYPFINLFKRSNLPYNQSFYVSSPKPYNSQQIKLIGPSRDVDIYTTYHVDSYDMVSNDYEFKQGQSGSPVLTDNNELLGLFWGFDNNRPKVGYIIGVKSIEIFLNNSIKLLLNNPNKVIEYDF